MALGKFRIYQASAAACHPFEQEVMHVLPNEWDPFTGRWWQRRASLNWNYVVVAFWLAAAFLPIF